MLIREPVGVIGIACPDEFPLLSFVSLFAPAVIRANCVIVIPSEKFPIPALDFYQVRTFLIQSFNLLMCENVLESSAMYIYCSAL